MGQIKNIKLHIVTDIKTVTNKNKHTNMLKLVLGFCLLAIVCSLPTPQEWKNKEETGAALTLTNVERSLAIWKRGLKKKRSCCCCDEGECEDEGDGDDDGDCCDDDGDGNNCCCNNCCGSCCGGGGGGGGGGCCGCCQHRCHCHHCCHEHCHHICHEHCHHHHHHHCHH